jgi:DNA primase small subunit
MKIYDNFLVNDFGFSPDEIKLNYSGHRGYHIRVNNSRILRLDSSSRVEIVHYITGMGFNSEKVIVQQGRVTTVPPRRMPGWAGKIADAMVDFIRDIDSYTGKERWAQSLRTNKAAALEGLLRNPPILSPQVKGVGLKSWQEIAIKSATKYGGKIDAPVTHDIHRVIRLIGSLNGKTGFTVNPLDRDELTEFNPFADALAFTEGMMKVKFIDTGVPVPHFKLGEEEYGPFTNETLDLPIAAAVLVLCKGVATVE